MKLHRTQPLGTDIMSRLLITYSFFLLNFNILNGQFISDTILNYDFSSPLITELFAKPIQLERSNDIGFGNQQGKGIMFFNSTSDSIELFWTNTSAKKYDSLSINIKIEQYSDYEIKYGNKLTLITYDEIELFYKDDFPVITQEIYIDTYFDSIEKLDKYFLCSKNLVHYSDTTIKVLSTMNKTVLKINGELIETNIETELMEYCSLNYPNDNECSTFLMDQVYFGNEKLIIDDISITGFSTITPIKKVVPDKKKEIVAVFDSFGRKSKLDNKNQVLFIIYNDGSKEKVIFSDSR